MFYHLSNSLAVFPSESYSPFRSCFRCSLLCCVWNTLPPRPLAADRSGAEQRQCGEFSTPAPLRWKPRSWTPGAELGEAVLVTRCSLVRIPGREGVNPVKSLFVLIKWPLTTHFFLWAFIDSRQQICPFIVKVYFAWLNVFRNWMFSFNVQLELNV